MTDGFTLPLRVSESGERLEPSGIDPYTLPWVQGASATLHRRTRDKYRAQLTDLYEKLSLLRMRRKPRIEDDEVPVYGPRLRSPGFKLLDQRPLPTSKGARDE